MGVKKVYLVLICLATISLIALGTYILKMKNKKQISKAFLSLIFCMIICNSGYIFAIFYENFFGNLEKLKYSSITLSYIPFIGMTSIPVAFFFVAQIFAGIETRLSFKHLPLFLIPTLTNILLWTNDFHRLFYKSYMSFNVGEYGLYFFAVHIPLSYGCIFIGLYYFIRFSIKNAGFFSRQAMLIVLGSAIPFAINIMWVIGNSINNQYLKFYSVYDPFPIIITVSIICYALAIFKFDFLNVVPVALQTVVDLIPDCFIIINEDLNIIDYNKPFVDSFSQIIEFKRNINIIDIFDSTSKLKIDEIKFIDLLTTVMSERKSIKLEYHLNIESFDRYYNVDITPIIKNKKYLGTIILFKDITVLKRTYNYQAQQKNLTDLREMIEGVCHNTRGSFFSISIACPTLQTILEEQYKELVDRLENQEEKETHLYYLSEALDRIKEVLRENKYVSEIITDTKEQLAALDGNIKNQEFTLGQIKDRVEVVTKKQLDHANCELSITLQEENTDIKIAGALISLSQVLRNLVTNSIDEYNAAKIDPPDRKIELLFEKRNDNVEIYVTDYGRGIKNTVNHDTKIFTERYTSKGNAGTGIGLKNARSAIEGKFNGNISLCDVSVGTKIKISIPVLKN